MNPDLVALSPTLPRWEASTRAYEAALLNLFMTLAVHDYSPAGPVLFRFIRKTQRSRHEAVIRAWLGSRSPEALRAVATLFRRGSTEGSYRWFGLAAMFKLDPAGVFDTLQPVFARVARHPRRPSPDARLILEFVAHSASRWSVGGHAETFDELGLPKELGRLDPRWLDLAFRLTALPTLDVLPFDVLERHGDVRVADAYRTAFDHLPLQPACEALLRFDRATARAFFAEKALQANSDDRREQLRAYATRA